MEVEVFRCSRIVSTIVLELGVFIQQIQHFVFKLVAEWKQSASWMALVRTSFHLSNYKESSSPSNFVTFKWIFITSQSILFSPCELSPTGVLVTASFSGLALIDLKCIWRHNLYAPSPGGYRITRKRSCQRCASSRSQAHTRLWLLPPTCWSNRYRYKENQIKFNNVHCTVQHNTLGGKTEAQPMADYKRCT